MYRQSTPIFSDLPGQQNGNYSDAVEVFNLVCQPQPESYDGCACSRQIAQGKRGGVLAASQGNHRKLQCGCHQKGRSHQAVDAAAAEELTSLPCYLGSPCPGESFSRMSWDILRDLHLLFLKRLIQGYTSGMFWQAGVEW